MARYVEIVLVAIGRYLVTMANTRKSGKPSRSGEVRTDLLAGFTNFSADAFDGPTIRIPPKVGADHEGRIRANVERVRRGEGISDLSGLEPDEFLRKLLG